MEQKSSINEIMHRLKAAALEAATPAQIDPVDVMESRAEVERLRAELKKLQERQDAAADVPQIETVCADFCCVMPDDSMINAGIHHGDVVSFAACDHVEPGQIAAVRVKDAVLVRQVWADGQLLTPMNPAYMTEMFTRDELAGVQIIGRAVETRHIFE